MRDGEEHTCGTSQKQLGEKLLASCRKAPSNCRGGRCPCAAPSPRAAGWPDATPHGLAAQLAVKRGETPPPEPLGRRHPLPQTALLRVTVKHHCASIAHGGPGDSENL